MHPFQYMDNKCLTFLFGDWMYAIHKHEMPLLAWVLCCNGYRKLYSMQIILGESVLQ